MSRKNTFIQHLVIRHFPGQGYRALADAEFASYQCCIGPSGIKQLKREGDLATPAGLWPMRHVLFRPDRLPHPRTGVPVYPIRPDDGWCDDPGSRFYNRPVKLPFPASHERMWRTDHLYDLVVVIGHNDMPPIPGNGSAVFIHLQRPDPGPTHGCIAFSRQALLSLLRRCNQQTMVAIPA